MSGAWLLSAAEMRQAESAVFATGVASYATMRRAGNAVAEAISTRWPRRQVDRVLALCGPGNNGGDGFLAAARLRQEGWPVTLACVSQVDRLMGDAARAAKEWGETPIAAGPSIVTELGSHSLLIDALFGIGLARDLKDATAKLVGAANDCLAQVIAVDMPSGIDSDTGRVMGAAIRADVTVTFGWPKRGHLLSPGREHTGELLIAPVGLEGARLLDGLVPCQVNSPECWVAAYPLPGAADNKYTRGNVVIGAGPMPGAAHLAGSGVRGVGAGMATIWAPLAGLGAFAGVEPGIVIRSGKGVDAWGELAAGPKTAAIVAGCGFEPDRLGRDMALAALSSGRPTVIDGGGLSAFAEEPDKLFALSGPGTVLTPHAGEFGRLFPDLGQGSRIDRALAAARRSRAVLVLKGADTIIAAPGGEALVAEGLPPTLATAGSGDVLAGMIGGLLGLGMAPLAAAGMAVWMHGAAARRAGMALRAEALAAELPAALIETLRWR